MFREQHTNPDEGGDCRPRRSPQTAKIRVASFFAGIGGFDRAFELENAEVTFQCERDRFCRSVLQRHWPSASIHDDIRELSAAEIPDADVWTAGFPCQDVSLARGNHARVGLKGHHTSLFFKLVELVGEKRPTVLLLENVVGLLNSHRGQDFAVILNELTSLGYAVSWRIMNARYFGAPQSRPRIFICAWRGDYAKAAASLYEEVKSAKPGPERAAFLKEEVHPATGATVAEIAYCVSATSGRHTGLDWSRSYVSYSDSVRRPTPTESERLQGFPEGWTLPGETFKAPVRGLDSERYRAAGNAVAVPVVRWIAKRLLRNLRDARQTRSSDNLIQGLGKIAPDLGGNLSSVNAEQVDRELATGEFVHRWKSGGCAFGTVIVEGTISPAPSKIIKSSFIEALDETIPDERYFLTPNAAAGILRRADSVGRNLFPPMHRALEILVKTGKMAPPRIKNGSGEPLAASRIRKTRTEQRAEI